MNNNQILDNGTTPPSPPRSLWRAGEEESCAPAENVLTAKNSAPVEYLPEEISNEAAYVPVSAEPEEITFPQQEDIPVYSVTGDTLSEADAIVFPEEIAPVTVVEPVFAQSALTEESPMDAAEENAVSEPVIEEKSEISVISENGDFAETPAPEKRNKKRFGTIFGLCVTAVLIIAAAVLTLSNYAIVGGGLIPLTVTELNLRDGDVEDGDVEMVSEICRCKELKSLDLRGNDLSVRQCRRLMRALPECEMLFDVPVGESSYPNTTDYLDLSGKSDYRLSDIKAALPVFENLTAVDVSGGGFDNDKLLRFEKSNDIDMVWDMELGSATVSTGAVNLDLSGCTGVGYDEISQKVKYFSSLESIDLSGCGFDSDILAQFNESLLAQSGVGIIWDIEIGGNLYSTGSRTLIIEGTSEAKRNGEALTDISDLVYFTNLVELRLGNNLITNVSAIGKLTNLQALSLYNNEISSIAPLVNLKNLRQLDLSGNDISDISYLCEMTQLADLYLANNNITNVHPLSKLTSLKKLSLDNNMIGDLSPLYSLEQLEYLSLYTDKCRDDDFEYEEETMATLIMNLPECDVYYSMDYDN